MNLDNRCINCNNFYKTNEELIYHIQNTKCTKSFVCFFCKRDFYTKARLNAHLNRKILCFQKEVEFKNINDQFQCPLCNSEFEKKGVLSRHLENNCYKIKNIMENDIIKNAIIKIIFKSE